MSNLSPINKQYSLTSFCSNCTSRLINVLIFSLILLSMSACTIHRLDIQQGNIIEDDMVNELIIGSSKRQVRYVMGSPMLTDPFHADRWDYVFTNQPGNKRKIIERRHLSLYFENDKLVKIVKEPNLL